MCGDDSNDDDDDEDMRDKGCLSSLMNDLNNTDFSAIISFILFPLKSCCKIQKWL